MSLQNRLPQVSRRSLPCPRPRDPATTPAMPASAIVHLTSSHPRLVPARPNVCTRHVRESLRPPPKISSGAGASGGAANLAFECTPFHQPSRLDQIDQSQSSNAPWQPSLSAGSVKVNLKCEIGGFGLVVRFDGSRHHSARMAFLAFARDRFEDRGPGPGWARLRGKGLQGWAL